MCQYGHFFPLLPKYAYVRNIYTNSRYRSPPITSFTRPLKDKLAFKAKIVCCMNKVLILAIRHSVNKINFERFGYTLMQMSFLRTRSIQRKA